MNGPGATPEAESDRPRRPSVDVLVGHAYFLRHDPKQAQKAKPYPPLATLYVAAALRSAGHRVALFDAMLADGEAAFATALAEHRPAVVVLHEDNFNFLSKMCLRRTREAACTMVGMARAAGAYVVVAGSDVTDHPELYLGAGADVAVQGEGEHTVVDLVAWFAATFGVGADHAGRPASDHVGRPASDHVGRPASADVGRPASADGGARPRPDHLDGVVFAAGHGRRPGGEVTIVRTPKRRNERHPDVFPLPARDLVDIEAYRRVWLDAHGFFSLNVVSTRGCPFHCNWCAKPIWGQRYAMRSAAEVAAELAVVKERFAPDHVWFADDIFGLRPSWVTAFAEEVRARDAAIPFTIQSRCDLMSPEAVDALAAAGCRQVWLGAESGSQAVLDAMDKGITVQDIRMARLRLGAVGIAVGFFVQFGYPGETWDDIVATVDLIRETLPDELGVSVSYPLPGTRFHRMVADQLGEKANWDDSGDLDMMFRGTYTSAFYRALHTTLHDDLDLRRRRCGLASVPHPAVEPVDLTTQAARVDAAWSRLEALERSERTAAPTLLVRSEPMPAAPDLSRTYG